MDLTSPSTRAANGAAESFAVLVSRPLVRFVIETSLILFLSLLLYAIFAPDLYFYGFGSEKRFSALYILTHPISNPLFSDIALRLLVFGLLFIAFFAIVYYGTSFEVTPFTLILRPFRKILVRRSAAAGSSTIDEPQGPEDPDPDVEEGIEAPAKSSVESSNHKRESEAPGLGETDSRATVGQTEADEYRASNEMVYRVLRTSAGSAAMLAEKMERKINSYLILGVAMGFVGLGVWYFSFFIGRGAGGANPNIAITPWTTLWEFIPRVTILVFIELLAGFFLRQYRIGVEDFKYFLELSRRADASRIAYTVFDLLGDSKLKQQFASGLLEARSDSHLMKGETTTVLEAMKSEENTTLQLIGILGDHLESVTKLLHKGKGK